MPVPRRSVLGALLFGLPVLAVPACTSSGAASGPRSSATGADRQTGRVQPTRHVYGSDRSQFGELYLPTGRRRPGTAVVIHGGFWYSQYGLDLGAPLAADLARRGWAAWNLEYRRVGNGGGWPATLRDVAAGVDHLATLRRDGLELDLDHVVPIGHSAGGQLAGWAACRPGLPTGALGADPKVRVSAVVSQASVLDLRHAAETGVGGTAESDLLGGSPAQVSDRYRLASPIERLPLQVPVICVHGTADTNVPIDQSRRFAAAAGRAGDRAELIEVAGDHFTLIDVTAPAWAAVVNRLPRLFAA